MSMGFGCNAAGVVGCRIIDSPRERLIAIADQRLRPLQRQAALAGRLAVTMFFAGAAGLGGRCWAWRLLLGHLLGWP